MEQTKQAIKGQLDDARRAHGAEVRALRAEIVATKRDATRHVEAEARLQATLAEARAQMGRSRDESAEMRKSAETLTNSLVRLEEEREKWALQDNTHKSESLNLRNGLEKARQCHVLF